MDWTDCAFVERVPGRMSGVPVVVGSRVTPETILEHLDGGFSVEEIASLFSLPRVKVRGVVEYLSGRRRLAA